MKIKKRTILKSILCFALAIAIMISTCACAFDFSSAKEQGDKLLDKAKDNGNKLLSNAQGTFDKAKQKIASMYGTAKNGAIYVYNEAADLTAEGYAKATAKAKELVGNAEEFITGLDQNPEPQEIKYAECDPEGNLATNEFNIVQVWN